MTWLPIDAKTRNERDAVLGLQPEVFENHRAFLDACSDVLDPELLELCRARMAQTLGCREELARHSAERLAHVESPQQSDSLTALQKNALEFVDQFLIDPAIISTELATSLEDELGTRGVIDFATVISAFEASLRLAALLDLEPAS